MRYRGDTGFQRGARQPPQLPRGYLQNGYFDSQGNLWPEIIQQWPDEIAQTFRDGRLTTTQLRRFFNRARALEKELKTKTFERLKEDVATLKPIAAASVGRKTAPDIFKQFIDRNVDLVLRSSDSDALVRGFLTHFQSVVAYLKYYEEKRR
ncbi:MAG: type III-A CRISPR-associated protein Csm2 [Dehalococcoidia bacterium CG2_30_46_19]|nr:MAG: type III-A CRISPR-associated protein Csm2 [Dehalococcoidia bacterium CG2_30_46_19]